MLQLKTTHCIMNCNIISIFLVVFVLGLVSSENERNSTLGVLDHIVSLTQKYINEQNEQKAINEENKIKLEKFQVSLAEKDEQIKLLTKIQETHENEIEKLKMKYEKMEVEMKELKNLVTNTSYENYTSSADIVRGPP